MVAAPYKKHQNDLWISEYSHTWVKLDAKQLNIFGIVCKTTVFLDSIVNLKKNK
jgi:hypothetical protein